MKTTKEIIMDYQFTDNEETKYYEESDVLSAMEDYAQEKLKEACKLKNFESALSYMKSGGFCKRETIKNETVVILYKEKLMFLYQPNGIRFPYIPTNEDLLATDWMNLPK